MPAAARLKPVQAAPVAPAFTVVPKPAASPVRTKLNLAGIGKAKPKSEKIHPAAQSDEELQQAVAQFCEIKPRFDADKATIEEILRPQILASVAPQILSSHSGEYSMLVMGPLPEKPGQQQDKVMVTLTARYPIADFEATAAALVPVIGQERFDRYFQQSVGLTIDVGAIAENAQQSVIEEIVAVIEKHNATEAIVAKETIKPRDGFHESRRGVFTPEENMAIFAALPNVGMIKLKNVKK